MGYSDNYDLIDGTPLLVRYNECDGDESADQLQYCFKEKVSDRMRSNLSWLSDLTLLQRKEEPIRISVDEITDGGCVRVGDVLYYTNGRSTYPDSYQDACNYYRERVCLLVHTANWKIMREISNLPHHRLFDAMWNASDTVKNGPQHAWISKKSHKSLGYISYRELQLRDPATDARKRASVKAACEKILSVNKKSSRGRFQ